jgi:hypothetical protein
LPSSFQVGCSGSREAALHTSFGKLASITSQTSIASFALAKERSYAIRQCGGGLKNADISQHHIN